MSAERHILTGFLAGELDPHLDGRIDTELYNFGLQVCENFLPINEGPLVKRQGFEFIREAASTASWLSVFRRTVAEEYVLEWSENTLRFFAQEARIETSPGVAYEVATPYSAAEAPAISQQQSFNRRYLNHGKHAPRALLRNNATTFTLETLNLRNGPFLTTNSTESSTVSANAASGNVALTSSAGIFDADHVGSTIRLEAEDFADIKQWEPAMKGITIGDKVRNEGRVYQAASAGNTGTVEPIHDEGTFWDGLNENDVLNDTGPYGVKWTYLHDRFGIARITAVTNANSASATVERRLPDAVTGGTFKWALSVFSEKEGWPHLVSIYKGRRIDFKDLFIIGSVVDDYGGGQVNYQASSSAGLLAADLGFRRTIAAEDPPIWVSGDRRLLVGTATRELAIGAFNQSAAFSGENIEAVPQSFYGSEAVEPVQVGTETLFIERGGRRVRGADYDFGRDRYDAQDITASARHITQGGILQLAQQRVPHALVHGVRADGQLVVHPKTRLEIKGSCRFKLGGDAVVLSAAVAVGSDGKSDDLWVLVERPDKDGLPVREIWKQSKWRELGDDQKEAFYVDGGAKVAALAGDGSYSGFDHLAGQEVVALVNGVVVTGLTVANDGTLEVPADTVPDYDYTAIIGLPYTATATTMRPQTRNGRGALAGLRQRLRKVTSRVRDTLGLAVSVPGGKTEQLTTLSGGQVMNEPQPLENDDLGGHVSAEFDKSGRATWTSDKPLPATIALAVLNLEVSWDDD